MTPSSSRQITFTVDELRALSSKLKGWVVDGPEKAALDAAEVKIIVALTGEPHGPIRQS